MTDAQLEQYRDVDGNLMRWHRDEYGNIVGSPAFFAAKNDSRNAKWGALLDRYAADLSADERKLILFVMDEAAKQAVQQYAADNGIAL